MRIYLALLVLLLLAACLQRQTGIQQPGDNDNAPSLDGGAGGGGGGGIVLETCEDLFGAENCQPYANTTPIPTPTHTDTGTDNETDSETDDETDNETDDRDETVSARPPLQGTTRLDAIKISVRCNNCLHPVGKAETELTCVVEGCRSNFSFSTSSNSPRTAYTGRLCSLGNSETMRAIGNLKLKCTFRSENWWLIPDYRHSKKETLTQEIVANQHLCVITEDPNGIKRPEFIRPEVSFDTRSCSHRMLLNKQYRLAITFSW